jgi:hypothetical protein
MADKVIKMRSGKIIEIIKIKIQLLLKGLNGDEKA